MTDTPGRSIVRLRLNYDREDVTVDELRSPQAGRRLSNPRPADAGPKPQMLDEHPDGYDLETVVWELDPEDRVEFDAKGSSAAEMYVKSVVCLFSDEEWPPEEEPPDAKHTKTDDDDADTGSEADSGNENCTENVQGAPMATGIAETVGGTETADDGSPEWLPSDSRIRTGGPSDHAYIMEIRETRLVQVQHDGGTGFKSLPTTETVVEYEEGPIRCTCGEVFSETSPFRKHVAGVAGIGDHDVDGVDGDGESNMVLSAPTRNWIYDYEPGDARVLHDDAGEEADEEPAVDADTGVDTADSDT